MAARKLRGEIADYRFHPGSLRLSDDCRYEPDFLVISSDGTVEYHETKATWKALQQDKSKIKLKLAAEIFEWFTFRSIEVKAIPKRDGGGVKFTVTTIRDAHDGAGWISDGEHCVGGILGCTRESAGES